MFRSIMLAGLLISGVLVAANAPSAEATHGPHSFYFHDPAYNVTANGTYELILNETTLEVGCEILWTITLGSTSTTYASLSAELSFLSDCSPVFGLSNITAGTLAGGEGMRTMDVVAAHGENVLQHRMEWQWSGAIEDGPYGVGLAAKTSSSFWWWFACRDCPQWWWEVRGCLTCGYNVVSRAHSAWVNVWVDGYEYIDTRSEGVYGYPGQISCWGEKMVRDQFYPMKVKCEKLFYAPGDPVPPW